MKRKKLYFLKVNMPVYLLTKFQFATLILTSFRQWLGIEGILTPLTSKRTYKKTTEIGVKVAFYL